ncbi:MAG: DUF551 domain-containing protein [Bacteroidales bacterium]|jgi:hypothetical protein|nr:DUF551 domain-containing protein [Bacteroidales bacterium]
MKTVKEAAKEYAYELEPKCIGGDCGFACKEKFCNKDIGNTFIAGVEFAQKWISVEDELPVNSDSELLYLVRQSSNNISLACSYRNNIFWSKSYIQIKEVTHWRYVELIKKR